MYPASSNTQPPDTRVGKEFINGQFLPAILSKKPITLNWDVQKERKRVLRYLAIVYVILLGPGGWI